MIYMWNHWYPCKGIEITFVGPVVSDGKEKQILQFLVHVEGEKGQDHSPILQFLPFLPLLTALVPSSSSVCFAPQILSLCQ